MAIGFLRQVKQWLHLDDHRGIIDQYPMPIFAVDVHYRYLDFNPAHVRMMKALFSADIKLGRSFLAYQSGFSDVQKTKKNLDRALAGETVIDHTLSNFLGGAQGYFEVIHYPLRDSHQHVYGAVVHVRDITDQYNAEIEAKILQERLIVAQRVGKVGSWEYHIEDDIIWGSEEASRIFGLTHVEGDYPIDVIQNCIPDYKMVRQALMDLVNQEKPYHIEFAIQPIGSTKQKIITSAAELVRDKNGTPLKVVGVIQDVTEQRETEQVIQETQARFYRIVMEAPFPTIIHAEDGEITFINRAWTALSGYSIEDIPTVERWIQLAYGERKQSIRQGIDRLFESDQKVAEGEFSFTAKNGETRIWDFYSAPLGPLSDGRRIVLSMANDVTARKQAERAVTEANVVLEQRVHERTQALEAANEELASFVYSVSHDLRAPLRAVDGYSYLIMTDQNNQLSEKSLDYLNRIRDNAHTLSRIIDDLLSLSQTEREQLNESAVDLDLLVRQVVAQVQPEEEGHTLEMRYMDLPVCRGDAGLLKIVFVNLLSNAFKFTRFKEPALIEINGKSDGEDCIISVKDNGIGFDMAYSDRLFGVFERLHRMSEFEGTGIGLAIVKNIIEKHGGKIWAEAEENKGATFFLKLKRDTTGSGGSNV